MPNEYGSTPTDQRQAADDKSLVHWTHFGNSIQILIAIVVVTGSFYPLGLLVLQHKINQLLGLDASAAWYAASSTPRSVAAIEGLKSASQAPILEFLSAAAISVLGIFLPTLMVRRFTGEHSLIARAYKRIYDSRENSIAWIMYHVILSAIAMLAIILGLVWQHSHTSDQANALFVYAIICPISLILILLSIVSVPDTFVPSTKVKWKKFMAVVDAAKLTLTIALTLWILELGFIELFFGRWSEIPFWCKFVPFTALCLFWLLRRMREGAIASRKTGISTATDESGTLSDAFTNNPVDGAPPTDGSAHGPQSSPPGAPADARDDRTVDGDRDHIQNRRPIDIWDRFWLWLTATTMCIAVYGFVFRTVIGATGHEESVYAAGSGAGIACALIILIFLGDALPFPWLFVALLCAYVPAYWPAYWAPLGPDYLTQLPYPWAAMVHTGANSQSSQPYVGNGLLVGDSGSGVVLLQCMGQTWSATEVPTEGNVVADYGPGVSKAEHGWINQERPLRQNWDKQWGKLWAQTKNNPKQRKAIPTPPPDVKGLQPTPPTPKCQPRKVAPRPHRGQRRRHA